MSNTFGDRTVDGVREQPTELQKHSYRQCANCGAPIRVPSSPPPSSPPRAALWSDGYLETTEVPEEPTLGKCRLCGAIGFLAELAPIEPTELLRSKADHTWMPLTAGDYAVLLENLEEISEPFHLYVRMRFWQLSNHPRRGHGGDQSLSEAERANLNGLLRLLGNKDPERLIKAEILRQLRQFEDAETLLAEPFDQQLAPLIQRLRGLLDDRSASVVKIFSGEPGDEIPAFLRP